MVNPLAVSRKALAESVAIVRPGMLTRAVPDWVASGPSSAKAGNPVNDPVAASTISTVGAVVTAAVAPDRTGCTNLAKVVAFMDTTADTGRTVEVGPMPGNPPVEVPEKPLSPEGTVGRGTPPAVEVGVRDAFSTVPFTT